MARTARALDPDVSASWINRADLGKMLSRQQAAHVLGVGPERVRQMTVSGLLPSLPTALGNLYDPNDVEALRLSREK